VVELKIHLNVLQQQCIPENLVVAIYHLWRHSQVITPSARALKWATPLLLAKIWPIISHNLETVQDKMKVSTNH